MKYKAYQIAPEYQESPLYMGIDDMEELEIYGNKDYEQHTSKLFDNVLTSLEDEDFNYIDIAKALSIVTGKNWKYKRICGCCQSDWNYIYYREDLWTDKEIEYFEIEYFNLGEEWRVVDEEGEECYYYTHELSDVYKRQELVEIIGCNVQDLTLYAFGGWEKIPKYYEL